MTLQDRFWSKVDKSGDCWEWTGSTNNRGYGTFRFDGGPKYAHRVSWYLHCGVMPSGNVLHACDNPICVNPAHLSVGSHTDNMRDMTVKGRNKARKLSDAAVSAILTSNLTNTELAEKFGVTRQAVHYRRRAAWTHYSS